MNNTRATQRGIIHVLVLLAYVSVFVFAAASPGQVPKSPSRFAWPDGKKAAVSLTFDDARLSQVDNGLAILNRHGLKATFYVSPDNMAQRLEGWRRAVRDGHEIGNHTLTHPCTGNFDFSRENALEDYTLERMAREIDEANAVILKELGVKPRSFGYPCDQSNVGRGKDAKSYIPLVAARFAAARGWTSGTSNDPFFCDIFQLVLMESDGRTFASLKAMVEEAAAQGRWLILCGHEIGPEGYQTTLGDALDALCAYLAEPANGIWTDTVSRIGDYVLSHRQR